VSSLSEGRFLTAILNSATLTERVRPLQSRGQFGARDFDKYVWNVPIPLYDGDVDIHVELPCLAEHAESVAAAVDVSGVRFQAARGRVRHALEEDGVAAESNAPSILFCRRRKGVTEAPWPNRRLYEG
jgi:hypothetical protein